MPTDAMAGRCTAGRRRRAPAPRLCALCGAAFICDDAKSAKMCPKRIESVRVLSFANSRARFTATPHSCGTEMPLIKNTHTKIRAQSAERSRLGPCTMETEHREHGRTRGAAAASSEPGARGISVVDHAWYVTCVSTARVRRTSVLPGRSSERRWQGCRPELTSGPPSASSASGVGPWCFLAYRARRLWP